MTPQTKRPLTVQDYKTMGGLLLVLIGGLLVSSLLSGNLGGFLGLIVGVVLGFVLLAVIARVENGQWPLKLMRDKWH